MERVRLFPRWFLISGLTLVLVQVSALAVETPALTTVVLVRHAEKVDSSDDPDLSQAGRGRAERLAQILKKQELGALFVTEFKRTQQTLRPLSEASKVELTRIAASRTRELVQRILQNHQGQVVVVAGHSNTVPEIIEALGGATVEPISESEYDNLFIVTVGRGETKTLRLSF